jgi:glycosyltransferase involved in cell wall biosynthesis
MLVTFRLSALGFGGTERVFLSIADFLSSTYGWQINFVVDKISGHETEQIARTKSYEVIGLNAARTWKSIRPFAQYLKEKKPDIVFSAYTEVNAAALISNALNRFRTPVIVTEHASLDEHWRGRSHMKKLMLECIVRYVYRLADRVLCVSRGVAGQLGKRLSHPHISYIHNPARFTLRTRAKNEARQALGVGQDDQMILAVGRICKQKNYLMLLNAFKDSPTSDKQRLYIVGGVHEMDEKKRIDQFIADHQLAGLVHFVDFIEDVHIYYEAADLLALSSAWEGFGNVLVEALAFGLPIVSSRCNYGPSEILADGEFGVLVDVGDSIAMGKAIQQLLKQNPFDPARQIQRAEAFSESRIGEEYYRLICATSGRAL